MGDNATMKEKVYEEVGANYRFFLKWRHAAAAGDLVALWAVIMLCVSSYKDARQVMWIVPLLASPLGIIFWIIDFRIRKLFRAAIEAGANLEKEDKAEGFYSHLNAKLLLPEGKSSFMTMTQSFALDLMFFGTSFVLFLLSIWFFVNFATVAGMTVPEAMVGFMRQLM